VRVVSLVPSLTEAVALTAPETLVGATDYCVHPAGVVVVRVGGSKYPRIEKVLALRPDLVLVNEEENRLEDAETLRAAGIELFVTFPRTVDGALADLRRLCAALGRPDPTWLTDADETWAAVHPGPVVRGGPMRVAVVPVWRRPWVVLGPDTFAADVLRRLGVTVAPHAERYPRPSIADIRDAPLVVFPDEPYAFSADDGPDAFPHSVWRFVSGRHLTWYGPSLREAPDLLRRQLGSLRT
jgi:ABC-type Fe3+-hydroxamate transport system substrate-binding protein